MKTRLAVYLSGVTFAVTLAIVIGTRLSDQAMFVVVGVIAGVAASIPTSLIVVWLATRHLTTPAQHATEPERIREPEPRVIVVQAPPQATPYGHPDPHYPARPPLAEPREARHYTIIGGNEPNID